MPETLNLALQITVIGMGLVFASILLLWGLMAALVSITTERVPAPAEKPVPSSGAVKDDVRALAAAAAVGVVLNLQARVIPPPPTSTISPWQSVMRGRQLKQRGNIR